MSPIQGDGGAGEGYGLLLSMAAVLEGSRTASQLVRCFMPGIDLDNYFFGEDHVSESEAIPEDMIVWDQPICLACL